MDGVVNVGEGGLSDDTVLYIKMAVVGSGGVGKSAVTIQFMQNRFVSEYDPTIEDIYRRHLTVDDRVYMLDILDTAGQEEYRALRDSYIREREAFMVLFSIVSRESFERVPGWFADIERVRDAKDFPCVLVGNKMDLEESRKVNKTEAELFANQWGCPYKEVSAKTRWNLEEAFFELVRVVRKKKESGCKGGPRKKDGGGGGGKCSLL